MAKRASAADLRRVGDRLRALRADPAGQRAYAAELIAQGDLGELLPQVLAALGPPFDPAIRPALVARYVAFDSSRRTDPGAYNRSRLLAALAPIATSDDLDLFLDAVGRQERSAQEPHGPSALRAAALVGLEQIDPQSAVYHAMRLLADQEGTLEMTGEPAVTAVRVLANLGQENVLYYHALTAGRMANSEALGEAIRSLVNLRPAVVDDAIGRFGANPDDVVAAGACDLALAAGPTDAAMAYVRGVLESERHDLAGYLMMAIAALRKPAWLDVLYQRADEETNRTRMEMLIPALKAVVGDPRAKAAQDVAEYRLGTLSGGKSAAPPADREDEDDE